MTPQYIERNEALFPVLVAPLIPVTSGDGKESACP
jgi:hypothetical protein